MKRLTNAEKAEIHKQLEEAEKAKFKPYEDRIADLKCECRTCVYTDSPCVRSDYPSKDGVCSHYKNVFEENAELKQENKVLAQNLEDTEILNKTYEKRFSDLEKKNAELDCQKNRNKFCCSCANATERCFRNEIGCPCEKYKSYKEENAELKEKLKPENCLKSLAKSGFVKFTCENGNEHDQLTKAKELLKWALRSDPEHDKDFEKKWSEAEQFLKECK